MVNIYIVYVINLWPFNVSKDFTIGNSLFGAFKLTKTTNLDKYKHSGCDIGFDAHGSFLLSDDSGFYKNMIICGVEMSSLVHSDNKKKDILNIGKGPTDGLDDTTLTAEKEHFINFTTQKKKFV